MPGPKFNLEQIPCRISKPQTVPESLIQKLKSLLKKHLNSLAHRKDIFCDDKSSRVMKGSREKLHSALCKDSSEADKFKTCTFQDNEDSGEVCGTESASSLPRNVPQVNITKHQLGLTTSAASKVNSDPLMAVLDLQKGSCS